MEQENIKIEVWPHLGKPLCPTGQQSLQPNWRKSRFHQHTFASPPSHQGSHHLIAGLFLPLIFKWDNAQKRNMLEKRVGCCGSSGCFTRGCLPAPPPAVPRWQSCLPRSSIFMAALPI